MTITEMKDPIKLTIKYGDSILSADYVLWDDYQQLREQFQRSKESGLTCIRSMQKVIDDQRDELSKLRALDVIKSGRLAVPYDYAALEEENSQLKQQLALASKQVNVGLPFSDYHKLWAQTRNAERNADRLSASNKAWADLCLALIKAGDLMDERLSWFPDSDNAVNARQKWREAKYKKR